MKPRLWQLFRIAVAICLFPITTYQAFAHAGLSGAGDFWNGALHPILDPVQGLTFLALGMGLVRTQTTAAGQVPFLEYIIGFASAIGLSLVFPPSDISLGPVALITTGILLIDPWGILTKIPRLSVGAAAVVAGSMFGLDIPFEVSRLIFASGICISAVLIPVYVGAAWKKFYRPWFLIAERVIGSWCIAIGVMVAGAILTR